MSTLRARLAETLGGVVRPAGVEYEAGRIAATVAEWLREQADRAPGPADWPGGLLDLANRAEDGHA